MLGAYRFAQSAKPGMRTAKSGDLPMEQVAMADVTGPISTLPGALKCVPEGATCDDHPERPATHRMQGETDSFGSEMHDLCDECYREMRAAMNEPQEAFPCDYCKVESSDLRPVRDPDEGMCGPVYYVCEECRRKQYARLEEEAREFDRGDDYDEYDDGDDWDDGEESNDFDDSQEQDVGATAYVDGELRPVQAKGWDVPVSVRRRKQLMAI